MNNPQNPATSNSYDLQKINNNPNNQQMTQNHNIKEQDKVLNNLSEANSKLNSEIYILKEKINELNNTIKELKNENKILFDLKKNIENPHFKIGEKEVKNSLYESLIIYLKNLNLTHMMEVYQLNLQREEDIRKILESKKIPETDTIKNQIKILNDNFNILKNNCENALMEYFIRSKSYISYEDLENKVLEHKNFTENILNLVLGKFFDKKDTRSDFILFKFEHSEYNQIIEDLTTQLDTFHKKEFTFLENYRKNLNMIESAIEVLIKQTMLDSDKFNHILSNPDSKLI